MFTWLGYRTARHRWWVLTLAGLFTVAAALWGTSVVQRLQGGGYADPDSESERARVHAERVIGAIGPDVLAIYSHPTHTVDDPAFRDAVQRALATLPRGDVEQVVTYWATRSPDLVSRDRHATYVALRLVGDKEAAYERVEDRLRAPGLTVQLTGALPIQRDVETQTSADLARAEMLSMPALLVLLVVIFGSLVAAATPLAIGGLAILGALTLLKVLTLVTDVSIFAMNIVTMIGLGLAIDYALFIVSRFREELDRQPDSAGDSAGDDVIEAVARTVATAGRTVVFSALTVAMSLAGLLLFPQMFLRSIGMGGIAAVLFAMLAAVTVLPALLAVLGRRVDALRLPWFDRSRARGERGLWYRVARSVMRRPVLYASVLTTVLVVLALPFTRVSWGWVDARVLPAGTESRVAQERLQREFPGNVTNPIEAVVILPGPVERHQAALGEYVQRIRALPGVTGAQVTGARADTARVSVRYEADPTSEEARELVRRIRALPAPAGARVLVGGQTAELVDLLDGLGDRMPWMALFVGVVTFVLLFAAFGSVVLPFKALVMNLLSLTASFGALVLVFQDGHFAGWLDFTPTGYIEATTPLIMLVIAFGLSMDYEVFLLSRVREQWDLTRDNAAAVAAGLQRTGRIITGAALLLIMVIAAFSTAGVTLMKMVGVGLGIAVALDATVVRALLVPATMRLLGTANWWAPAPLARWWERYGLRETDEPAPRIPVLHGEREPAQG
ncbi:hypothetical protein C3Y87_13925 [Carbonactinospora thermoautotrophica]|uniref:MMPL family transporter n=1 Tax=Carbonactinospora thermoautotrophica TaxID=1469144 RepID=UPI00226E0D1B|nr:MMPL family transporter [Carbonactinospora thermoautotrophica]MCX9192492.1 hypothetical protein [Carbonactinospora thermoautotrophica]